MAAPKKAETADSSVEEMSPRCGMIRPIADMDDYSAAHWREVHDIVAEPVKEAGYELKLVSESDASSVILSEIVTNIYTNDLVIADVSGRNANVMFELGMRMAFQKPVIIIMDDNTPFSFDISPVKHLIYPKTLRFSLINEFKFGLRKMIDYTLSEEGKKTGTGYLKQFGRIEVSGLETQHMNANQMAQDIADLKRYMGRMAISSQTKPLAAWQSEDPASDISSPWADSSTTLKSVRRHSIDVVSSLDNKDKIIEIINGLIPVNETRFARFDDRVSLSFGVSQLYILTKKTMDLVRSRILAIDPLASVKIVS